MALGQVGPSARPCGRQALQIDTGGAVDFVDPVVEVDGFLDGGGGRRPLPPCNGSPICVPRGTCARTITTAAAVRRQYQRCGVSARRWLCERVRKRRVAERCPFVGAWLAHGQLQ